MSYHHCPHPHVIFAESVCVNSHVMHLHSDLTARKTAEQSLNSCDSIKICLGCNTQRLKYMNKSVPLYC